MQNVDDERLQTDNNVKYFLFKKFLKQGQMSVKPYDPSEYMIIDAFTYVIVATTKILRIKAMKKGTINTDPNNHSIPFFIPADYLISELSKQMRTTQAIQSMVFGRNFKSEFDNNYEEFDELIEALADESLGGINTSTTEDIDDDILKSTTNLIAVTAPLQSHSQRKQYWKKKLTILLFNGGNQWILDQFNYCKILILDNCIEISHEEYTQKASKEQGIKLNYFEDSRIETKGESIKVINSTSLIGNITAFEKNARATCKADFEANGVVSKKTIKCLQKENPFKVKRFLSSGFAYSNKAWEKFHNE